MVTESDMTHSVTGKLNKDAHEYPHAKGGVTFFVKLGEQNYDHKTKQREWTNYSAGLYASENQIQYHRDKLKAGAIVTVSGNGLLIHTNEHGTELVIQNPSLDYAAFPTTPVPNEVRQQFQTPQAPNFDEFDDDTPF